MEAAAMDNGVVQIGNDSLPMKGVLCSMLPLLRAGLQRLLSMDGSPCSGVASQAAERAIIGEHTRVVFLSQPPK